jgi:lipopolysaccharide transport system ATP-binding protein
MSDIAIKVENLSKSYMVGHKAQPRERYTALRDVIVQNAKSLARKTRDMIEGRPIIQGDDVEEFWALKDINFEIKQGDRVGIIGRNGAGKSTLLKILSRITEPTTGRVTLSGRVASLLEVGTGFHPELTGRENIYLNGAILGMSRKEIQRKFDEIVDFAEVEKFLDTPVKRYSSGMYVRLAFSVAAHLEPEILVVDEVLAVGDTQFQKKCLGKMENVAGDGRTVLFVSHNMAAIESLCRRVVLLQDGRLIMDGQSQSSINKYLGDLSGLAKLELRERTDRKGNGGALFTGIDFIYNGKVVPQAITGKPLTIKIYYEIKNPKCPNKKCRVSASAHKDGRPLFLASSELTNAKQFDLNRIGHVQCTIPRLPLSQGDYIINLFLECGGEILDWIEAAAILSVSDGDYYGNGKNYPQGWAGKTVLVDHYWNW